MAMQTGWRRGRWAWFRVLTPLLAVMVQANSAAAGALERAMLGKSAIVDLTHSEGERTVLTEPQRPTPSGESEQGPAFSGQARRDFGTRLNALGVVRKDKRSIAQIPLHELLAPAVVVNIIAKVAGALEYRVTVEDLLAWERQNGRIPRQSAVLLYTGWARRWGDAARYANLDAQGVPHVPGFSAGVLAFLVNERQVRGVGLDAFIPDAQPAAVPLGVWQIENLANLDRLPTKGAKLIVAPIRLEAAFAPARVIGILP
jgi:kynurenine formamidase